MLAILRKYSGDAGEGAQGARQLIGLFKNIDPDHPALKAFAPVRSSQDREIATTLSEALKFVTKLISGDVEAFLNRNDVDFGALGEEREFLYLVVPTDRPSAGRMFVLLFQQMHQMRLRFFCDARSEQISGQQLVPYYYLVGSMGLHGLRIDLLALLKYHLRILQRLL